MRCDFLKCLMIASKFTVITINRGEFRCHSKKALKIGLFLIFKGRKFQSCFIDAKHIHHGSERPYQIFQAILESVLQKIISKSALFLFFKY